ncbi:MAG TPA: hypothetical protein VLH79_04675, partial [Chthonomonadales bacterium]|nr:hypothetical protein [Chthonomonadales bacterium]
MANIATRAAAVLVTAALAVALSGGRAAADTYSLFFNKTFGAADPQPASPAPWLTAVFEDVDQNADSVYDFVRLTLAAPGLAPGEFPSEWYFNVGGNDAAEATTISGMTAEWLGEAEGGVKGTPYFAQNAFKAGGDGWFDLIIEFPRGEDERLVSGDTSVYKLTGVNVARLRGMLSAPWKDLDVAPPVDPGGYGPFLAAAHIQG